MKTLRLLSILMIALSVSIAGCKKEDDGGGNNNVLGGSMSAKVNGSSWSASLAVGAVNSNGVLSVTGSGPDGTQCNVTLHNIPGPGTYEVGNSPTNPNLGRWTGGLSSTQTYTTGIGLGSGTVTITELSGSKVSGTFSFTAKNTEQTQVSITEGSFSANL